MENNSYISHDDIIALNNRLEEAIGSLTKLKDEIANKMLFGSYPDQSIDEMIDEEFNAMVARIGGDPISPTDLHALIVPEKEQIPLDDLCHEILNEFHAHESYYIGLVAERIKGLINDSLVYTNSGILQKGQQINVVDFLAEYYLKGVEGEKMCLQEFSIMSLFMIICDDYQVGIEKSSEIMTMCHKHLLEDNNKSYCDCINKIVDRINLLPNID